MLYLSYSSLQATFNLPPDLGSNQDLDQFKAKVNDENASLSEITGLVRDKSKTIPASVSLYLNYVEEFYAILDQTQQAELRAEFKKKLNRYWD